MADSILTKQMHMHLMHGSVLGAFHPSAVELYNNTNDLRYVCKRCTDPAELVAEGDIEAGIFLMQPLKPMLASVVDSAKLRVLLKDEKLIVEPKYDGERMMIHVADGRVQYWTRNAKDYTDQYGPKFTSTLLKQLHGVTNCILDGEFLLYDLEAKQFREFGHNRTFAREGGGLEKEGGLGAPPAAAAVDDSKLCFCYAVFDIVFLNGESLLKLPLTKRKEILCAHVRPLSNRLEVVPFTPCTSVSSVLMALDTALSNRHEGIVIKLASSGYTPGERKLRWMKLKPDHIAGMADTMDLIILGAYYGTKYGQRRLSHFLLGVVDDAAGEFKERKHSASDAARCVETSDAGAAPSHAAKWESLKFVTVTKVGSGYSDKELEELLSRLESKWMTFESTVPPWLAGWRPQAGDVPNVYIHPKDSAVMEVFGYTFTATTKFSFGQTIRFPRCHRFRYDKTVQEATTLSQLRELLARSGQFHRKAEAMEDFVTVRAQKKARKEKDSKDANGVKKFGTLLGVPFRTIAVVPQSIVVTQKSEVQVVSDLFNGFEFCILSTGNDTLLSDRVAVEKLILSHNGRVVANPQPRTSMFLAGSASAAKVTNWIRACTQDPVGMESRYASTDIAHTSWALECIEAQSILPLAPRHMIYTSRKLQRQFDLTLDPFHDSFYDDATLATLKSSVTRYVQQRHRQPPQQPAPSSAATLLKVLQQSEDENLLEAAEVRSHSQGRNEHEDRAKLFQTPFSGLANRLQVVNEAMDKMEVPLLAQDRWILLLANCCLRSAAVGKTEQETTDSDQYQADPSSWFMESMVQYWAETQHQSARFEEVEDRTEATADTKQVVVAPPEALRRSVRLPALSDTASLSIQQLTTLTNLLSQKSVSTLLIANAKDSSRLSVTHILGRDGRLFQGTPGTVEAYAAETAANWERESEAKILKVLPSSWVELSVEG